MSSIITKIREMLVVWIKIVRMLVRWIFCWTRNNFAERSIFIGTGLVGSPACGDVMKLQFEVDDTGKIIDAKFKTFGCGSAIASSSVATEWLKGRTVDDCMTIKNTDIASHLKLPPVKLHCSMLAEDAIKSAIADYKSKQSQPA